MERLTRLTRIQVLDGFEIDGGKFAAGEMFEVDMGTESPKIAAIVYKVGKAGKAMNGNLKNMRSLHISEASALVNAGKIKVYAR